jgi:hypothetical protein
MFTSLPQLLNKIRESGLFDPFALPFCAKFTRNLKLYYNNDKKNGFFVKACLNRCAEREYKALKFAYSRTDNHVPEPLMFVETGILTAYISPLYHFLPLNYDDLFCKPLSDQICRILHAGIVPCDDCHVLDSGQIGPDQLRSFAIDEKIITDSDRHCIEYISNSYCMLSSIRQVPQHCDLTPYNFSIEKNRVFLCDWEDFGIVCFPGFDLATFILGIVQMAGISDKLADRPDILERHTFEKFIGILSSSGVLSFRQWQALFPFYILLFAYLKKNLGYNIDYFNSLQRILRIIFHAVQWQNVFKRLVYE